MGNGEGKNPTGGRNGATAAGELCPFETNLQEEDQSLLCTEQPRPSALKISGQTVLKSHLPQQS